MSKYSAGQFTVPLFRCLAAPSLCELPGPTQDSSQTRIQHAAWAFAATYVVLNLLLIPTPFDDEVFPLNGPAWSIFLELFANLAHVLVLSRLSTRTLAWWTALLLVPVTWMALDRGLAVGARPDTMLLGIPRVLLPYSIGVLIWRLWGDTPPLRVSRLFAFAAMPALFVLMARSGLRDDWARRLTSMARSNSSSARAGSPRA